MQAHRHGFALVVMPDELGKPGGADTLHSTMLRLLTEPSFQVRWHCWPNMHH